MWGTPPQLTVRHQKLRSCNVRPTSPMAGCGYLVQGPVPAPSTPHCHVCWVLSPQVLVSYYLPDEDVPVATAVLYLTGVSECPPHPGREGGGAAAGGGAEGLSL